MKFTILTAPSMTDFSDFGKRFEASCSQWMEQCVALANDADCFTRATRPLFFPTMEAAPLVLMPTHLCQSKWFACRNSSIPRRCPSPLLSLPKFYRKGDLRAHVLHTHISRMSVAVLRDREGDNRLDTSSFLRLRLPVLSHRSISNAPAPLLLTFTSSFAATPSVRQLELASERALRDVRLSQCFDLKTKRHFVLLGYRSDQGAQAEAGYFFLG